MPPGPSRKINQVKNKEKVYEADSWSARRAVVVSTVAMGQYGGGSPFPQAANPALRNGEVRLPLIVDQGYRADSPSSIAANQRGMSDELSRSVLAWRHKVDTGSPFPQTANPSLGSRYERTDSHLLGNVDTGSPFPQAANPSRGSE